MTEKRAPLFVTKGWVLSPGPRLKSRGPFLSGVSQRRNANSWVLRFASFFFLGNCIFRAFLFSTRQVLFALN